MKMPVPPVRPSGLAGFTVMELVLVLAILAAVLLPALARAKDKAQQIGMKQVILGVTWIVCTP
jgi:type II secretory pathway pseudopilin PulG